VQKVAQEKAVTSFVDLTASSVRSLRNFDFPVLPNLPERHHNTPGQLS